MTNQELTEKVNVLKEMIEKKKHKKEIFEEGVKELEFEIEAMEIEIKGIENDLKSEINE